MASAISELYMPQHYLELRPRDRATISQLSHLTESERIGFFINNPEMLEKLESLSAEDTIADLYSIRTAFRSRTDSGEDLGHRIRSDQTKGPVERPTHHVQAGILRLRTARRVCGCAIINLCNDIGTCPNPQRGSRHRRPVVLLFDSVKALIQMNDKVYCIWTVDLLLNEGVYPAQ